MSGFLPIFNKRRGFIKNTLGIMTLAVINPLKVIGNNTRKENKMIQIIKKSDQFNDVIFGGRFFANKPVFNGNPNTKPYSNLFYWSNGYVKDACEFGLHPHEGFEIMTFIFEGSNEHYDTATQVWTPLNAGDFQIIQSNSGIRHQEKISKGTRAFQIWFDPNFNEAVKLEPSYTDYHSKDFQPIVYNSLKSINYIGDGGAVTLTKNIVVKKLIFDKKENKTIVLKNNMCYTFYVLKGNGILENNKIETDDAIRIESTTSIELDFEGEIFYIETPKQLDYKPIWG